jgi:hypothetical protein
MKKDEPLASYDFDDDKKAQITRYTLEKMLKDIKALLPKHGKLTVVITKSQ